MIGADVRAKFRDARTWVAGGVGIGGSAIVDTGSGVDVVEVVGGRLRLGGVERRWLRRGGGEEAKGVPRGSDLMG